MQDDPFEIFMNNIAEDMQKFQDEQWMDAVGHTYQPDVYVYDYCDKYDLYIPYYDKIERQYIRDKYYCDVTIRLSNNKNAYTKIVFDRQTKLDDKVGLIDIETSGKHYECNFGNITFRQIIDNDNEVVEEIEEQVKTGGINMNLIKKHLKRKTAKLSDDEIIKLFEENFNSIDDLDVDTFAGYIAPIDDLEIIIENDPSGFYQAAQRKGYFDGWKYFKGEGYDYIEDSIEIPFEKATKKEFADFLRNETPLLERLKIDDK